MIMDLNESVPSSKATEYRRVIKPLLERRRRARINQSLGELKNLISETVKHENLEPSKLEKADILELTVKHLKVAGKPRPHGIVSDHDRFVAGFAECTREVSQYVTSIAGVDLTVKQRLLKSLMSHLQHRFSSSDVSPPNTPPPSPCPSEASSYYSSQQYSPSSQQFSPASVADFEDSTSFTMPLNLSAKMTLYPSVMTEGHLTPISPAYTCDMVRRPVSPWRPW